MELALRASIAAAALAVALGVGAAEVGGVKLDDKVRLSPSGPELVLNGAGIRTRIIVKVYVGALYLPEKKAAAADVLAAAGPKRVGIHMLRDVGAQAFADALIEGFRNNNADADRFKPQLDELVAIMNGLGEAKKGDVIALDFVPGTGTTVAVNGAAKGRPIAGDDFHRALLRIWLGDRPVDGDLKKGMLGQSG